MDITLLWWLIPILIAGELGTVAWVRRDRYPRFLFHTWAPTLYLIVIWVDVVVAALLSALLGGGSRAATDQVSALTAWAIAAGLAVLAAAGLTLFFRWVTRTDITDIPD